MQKIVSLAKRRGFIYPSSEIYGGMAGIWDYGHLGSILKKNIKDRFWKDIVQLREDIISIDSSIIANPRVWEASGHVKAFTDSLVECKTCHKRFRSDKKEEIREHEKKEHSEKTVEWTEPKQFNLLVRAFLGIVEEQGSQVYLRGEITQGVHYNFKNLLDSNRIKLPFGIAQIGKAFRNEITPGNFTFRSREFEQMEIQYFIAPEEKESMKWYEYWKRFWFEWYANLGIKKANLRFNDHKPHERAHYAKAATDIEYQAPWGWSEFLGVHHRGDWDLTRHQQYSKKPLYYRNSETGAEFIPWDIESSIGVDRSLLFFLLDAYSEDSGRVVLRLHPSLAPYKAAVFPLVSNKENLVKKAKTVYMGLKKYWMVAWDDRGNIGKRYASQDEIGTPFCITIDYTTIEDDTVTIRDRDTTKQERISINQIQSYLENKIV